MSTERKIYGQTGQVGKDGLLTTEQQALLNRIQEKAARNSFMYLSAMKDEDSSPMVAMATGIGKGRIIHKVIERQMRQKPESKVLVIAGTKLVLVKQTHQALRQYQEITTNGNGSAYVESEEDDKVNSATASIGDNPLEGQQSFLYSTGRLRQQDANVHIATIQSIQSEISRGRLNPDDYDLLIVDEVHNIGTKKRKEVIDKFKKVVGFTATPYRHSGRIKTPEQYGFRVVEPLPLPEAQELRLLPPLLGTQIDTKDLIEEVPTTSTGKIDFAKLEKLLKDSPDLRPFIAERVAKIIADGERRYKTVIAVNFVWEAQELAWLLKEKGIKVGVAVNQQAAKEIHTDEIPAINTIERYKLPEDDPNSIQVLISPYVASEGFDAPATEVLVWASPTDSELRYTQYTGRLARRNEGKLFGVVIDCLYQTSQYSWSYNMGMWMKDDIKQLDNGMLWLGPETDIESLKKLPQVEAIRRQADVKPLTDLQKEDILEIQEGDLPITQKALPEIFIGTWKTLKPIADKVIELIVDKDPELIVKRRAKGVIVKVCTDKQKFKDLMKTHNVFLREENSPEDSGFVVTTNNLLATFVGSGMLLLRQSKIAIKRLRNNDQKLVRDLKIGSKIVPYVTDKKRFFDEMKTEGAMIRAEKDIQESEFALTYKTLEDTFVGSGERLMPLARIILEEMQTEDPDSVINRKSGPATVIVVKNGLEFKNEMLKRGILLRSGSIVGENDFSLTQFMLKLAFKGSYIALRVIADEIAEEFKLEDPSLVSEKFSGSKRISVITNKNRFFQEMVKRGAKLREK